ncbi:MAG: hypothetical protein H6729_02615 [Deltaproteobacteria bacterium]|nr:hypothetical protein [Deltaproteobacteria bacterium]
MTQERPQLLVCRDLREIGLFQLGTAAPNLLLLGWRGPPEVDAGPPTWLSRPLSIALAATGPVGFFTGEPAPDASGAPDASDASDAWGTQAALAASGALDAIEVSRSLMGRIAARLRLAEPLYLRVTTEPGVVEEAFDTPKAAWGMQAQILLGLSVLPWTLSIREAQAFVSDHWLDAIQRKGGVRWALRPAVDGAAAGLWFSDPQTGDDLLGRIRRAGVTVVEVDPNGFRHQT